MNQLWRSEYSLTHTTRGSVCALSNKVLDVIAEFTFHTDLFNCWTCLLDLQINGDIKVRHIMYMCITVSARKCGILTKLVLSLHNARYAEWHINYITWPQSHEVLEVSAQTPSYKSTSKGKLLCFWQIYLLLIFLNKYTYYCHHLILFNMVITEETSDLTLAYPYKYTPRKVTI